MPLALPSKAGMVGVTATKPIGTAPTGTAEQLALHTSDRIATPLIGPLKIS